MEIWGYVYVIIKIIVILIKIDHMVSSNSNSNSEDFSDVTDDVWLANRTSFRVRLLRMEVRLIVANQNRTQIHAIVYKQKPSLYILQRRPAT